MEARDKVLAAVVLPQFISEFVALERKAKLWVGRCPFHEERSASFTVYTDHYFCFGCRATGDAITFVRQKLGLTFPEALRHLAEKYRIDIPQGNDSARDKARSSAFQALLAAQAIFHKSLNPNVTDYLVARGLNPEDPIGFGFAAGDLARHLKHIPTAILEQASLINRKGHTVYDFFRNRLTIPIHDHLGRICGFGARSLSPDEMPKYKNSRESDVFQKSEIVFGLFQAKEALRNGKECLMTEGYMDVLQLWQHGYTGAVACMGTALKDSHLQRLRRFTQSITYLFDGDQAGSRATLAAASLALQFPEITFSVIRLPEGQDPDSFLRQGGRLEDLEKQKRPLVEWVLETKLLGTNPTNRLRLIEQELLPWIANLTSPLQQDFLRQRIAHLAGVSAASLQFRPVQQLKDAPKETQGRSPLDNRQQSFLGHLMLGSLEDTEGIPWDRVFSWDWPDEAVELMRARLGLLQQQGRGQDDAVSLSDRAAELAQELRDQQERFRVSNRSAALKWLVLDSERQHIQQQLSNLKQNLENPNSLNAVQALHHRLRELGAELIQRQRETGCEVS